MAVERPVVSRDLSESSRNRKTAREEDMHRKSETLKSWQTEVQIYHEIVKYYEFGVIKSCSLQNLSLLSIMNFVVLFFAQLSHIKYKYVFNLFHKRWMPLQKRFIQPKTSFLFCEETKGRKHRTLNEMKWFQDS